MNDDNDTRVRIVAYVENRIGIRALNLGSCPFDGDLEQQASAKDTAHMIRDRLLERGVDIKEVVAVYLRFKNRRVQAVRVRADVSIA